jgi:hypothetical protein
MKAAALCPTCDRLLGSEFWNSGRFQACPACSTPVMVTTFPSIAAPPGKNPVAPCETGESSCFFHTNNRAETVCDGCGRFLCGLCSVGYGKRRFCSDCVHRNRRQKSVPLFIDQAVLLDNIGISILALSVLTFTYLFLGVVVGLFAACLGIVGWRYQRTLVHRSRIRLVIALVLGLMSAGTWILLLVFVIQSLPHHV